MAVATLNALLNRGRGVLTRRRRYRPIPLRSQRQPQEWDLQFGATGALELHGIALAPLLAAHGSPLHVVDAAALDRNAQAALRPLADGEGIDVYSSYKTNPLPTVLDRLHRRGIGAEAISAYELWLALELGVAPERIIYNGPAKSAESLHDAARRGVGLTNANSLQDLMRMEAAASAVGRPMRAGIRVSMPHMWGGQFGISWEAPELVDAIDVARASPHLELVGLHVHSGFALRTVADYQRHLDAVVACCDRLRVSTGWWPEIIDLGGSLACASDQLEPGVPVLQVATASTMAARTIRNFAVAESLGMPTIVCEPGRALTANTQLLLTTVLDVRHDGDRRDVLLDIGVELAEPLSTGHHQLFLAGHVDMNSGAPQPRAPTPLAEHRLIGPHPRRRDVLVESCVLPTLAPGDVIAVMDTGAYFVPFSTASSHPRPAVVMVDPSRPPARVERIRDRETATHRQSLDVV